MKIQLKLASALVALGACLATSMPAGADDLVRQQKLFGEFVASNAGKEVAIPFVRLIDSNTDGLADTLAIRYQIFAVGGGTLLSTTPFKLFPFPAIPAGCTAGSSWTDYNVSFRRRQASLDSSAAVSAESTRLHTGIDLSVACYDGSNVYQEPHNAAVYSTDLSGVGGTWIKFFQDAGLAGLGGIDTDDNLITDTLVISVVKAAPGGGENIIVYPVHGANGTAAATARAYPIER